MCIQCICIRVCVHTYLCVSAGHTCPAHIWKSEHRISLFSLLLMAVSVEEVARTPPWSLVRKAPPWQARHHAQHDVGPGALHARPCAYLLSHLPPLFLFTYFFFLWILWIYAEFMGYSNLMVGIHLGKESPGDLCHAMSSTESTDLMWTLMKATRGVHYI